MSDRPCTEESIFRARPWKRWEPSAFERTPKPHNPDAAAETPPSKRAERIAAQIRQAQDAMREQARVEGYEAGHAQGRQVGYDEGRQAGHREGYETGHAEGLVAGHAEGAEKTAREARYLSAMARSCAQALGDIEEEISQALVSLGVRIAEHILGSTLDAQPEKITDIVRQIVRMNGQANHAALNLQINPADLDLVRQYLKTEPDTENWRLCVNDKIERGGCIAETALGSIDATLQTRWRRTLASLGCDAPQKGTDDGG